MTFDLPVKMLSCSFYNGMDTVHGQVNHLLTGSADKMVVIGDVGVKMIDSVAHPQTLYLADISKLCEIPIHGSETDVRIFLPHIGVDYIGGWMILTCHKKIFDNLPLTAVLHSHYL